MPKKAEKVLKYKAILKLNGKDYISEAKTLEQAILSLKPEFYKTRGFLKVKKGDQEVNRTLNIMQMRRIFGVGGGKTQELSLGFIVGNLKFLLGEKK